MMPSRYKTYKRYKKRGGVGPRRYTSPSDGKSRIEAAWLCSFLGEFGVHRFYLGYVGIGLIEALTFGGFGIWWIIDFIRIENGSLQPKYWHYQLTHSRSWHR